MHSVRPPIAREGGGGALGQRPCVTVDDEGQAVHLKASGGEIKTSSHRHYFEDFHLSFSSLLYAFGVNASVSHKA